MSDEITDPSLAIAEAIRTGKSVEVRRADGSVRVVVSVPGRDVSNEDDLRAENIRLRQLVSVLSDGNVEWEEECRRLKAALRWALDDIAEAWPYAGDYFQDKWRDVSRENELRAVVGMEPIAKGTNRE